MTVATLEKQYDAIGRRTRRNTKRDYNIKTTARSRQWFLHLAQHGLLNSRYLHEFTKHEHPNLKKALASVTNMVTGDYVEVPRQQFKLYENRFGNFHIYKLAERGWHTVRQEHSDNFIQPDGGFLHQYLTSCITSSAHLGCMKHGFEYVPGHTILDGYGAKMTHQFPAGKGFRADQLLGIDYGSKKRVCLIEADRSTEPGRSSNVNRKSMQRMAAEHHRYHTEKRYREHLGLDKAEAISLVVFVTSGQEQLFHNELEALVRDLPKKERKVGHICTQVVEGFWPEFKPLEPFHQLFEGPWRRCGMEEFYINQ